MKDKITGPGFWVQYPAKVAWSRKPKRMFAGPFTVQDDAEQFVSDYCRDCGGSYSECRIVQRVETPTMTTNIPVLAERGEA